MSTATQTVHMFLDAFAHRDVDAAMAVVDSQVAVTVHPFGLDEKARTYYVPCWPTWCGPSPT